MRNYGLLRSPLIGAVEYLFGSCQRSLFLASPYIKPFGISKLVAAVRTDPAKLSVTVLTNIQLPSLQQGSLDIGCLVQLCERFPNTTVTSLPSLHAKVYLVDGMRAIVGSANFTRGGLDGNYEYGILLQGRRIVYNIACDMAAYSDLGSQFSAASLRELANHVEELRRLHADVERTMTPEAARRLKRKAAVIEEQLLVRRVRGRTVNSIFADTIRYLLGNQAMTTEALESRIQLIHPDICDDAIDRVISGQKFGRLWKHAVRNAQQFLRRRGEIRRVGNRWRLN